MSDNDARTYSDEQRSRYRTLERLREKAERVTQVNPTATVAVNGLLLLSLLKQVDTLQAAIAAFVAADEQYGRDGMYDDVGLMMAYGLALDALRVLARGVSPRTVDQERIMDAWGALEEVYILGRSSKEWVAHAGELWKRIDAALSAAGSLAGAPVPAVDRSRFSPDEQSTAASPIGAPDHG